MSKHFLPSWIVIPAAGIGKRMGANLPKQYLPLHNKAVLEQTIISLSKIPQVKGIVVSIAEHDLHWETLSLPSNVSITTALGGKERFDSVLNGLKKIQALESYKQEDWVMVHDAARPCLKVSDVQKLHEEIQKQKAIGGILGVAVSDSLKRSDANGNISESVSRDGLWRAATPQMFTVNDLSKAIEMALEKGEKITDDAQAIALAGGKPIIVDSSPLNIKITQPEDLQLAELFWPMLNDAERK